MKNYIKTDLRFVYQSDDVKKCEICQKGNLCFDVNEYIDYVESHFHLKTKDVIACLDCIDGVHLSFSQDTKEGLICFGNLYEYQACTPSTLTEDEAKYIVENNVSNRYVIINEKSQFSESSRIKLSKTPIVKTNQFGEYPYHCNDYMNYIGPWDDFENASTFINENEFVESSDAYEQLLDDMKSNFKDNYLEFFQYQCSNCNKIYLYGDI